MLEIFSKLYFVIITLIEAVPNFVSYFCKETYVDLYVNMFPGVTKVEVKLYVKIFAKLWKV